MRWITGFFAFWYDFLVGDDWTVAAGVVIALIFTALLVKGTIASFWLLPLAVLLLLGASLQRAARDAH